MHRILPAGSATWTYGRPPDRGWGAGTVTLRSGPLGSALSPMTVPITRESNMRSVRGDVGCALGQGQPVVFPVKPITRTRSMGQSK